MAAEGTARRGEAARLTLAVSLVWAIAAVAITVTVCATVIVTARMRERHYVN